MASVSAQRALLGAKRLALLVTAVGTILSAGSGRASPILPASLCALIGSQVTCYDALTARPVPVTPADQKVIDFAISPEGNWLVYRTSEALLMVAIGSAVRGGATRVIDPQAAPPAAIAPDKLTLTWSPDSLGIAYLTALGFRIAYADGHFVDATDRPYISLKWSPGGGRLAAQSADGAWTFFESKPDRPLQITRVFAQAADMAWLADNAAILAPVAGGLLRLDPANATAPPAWYVADEHFIRLQSVPDGQVVALHPDPGDVIGSAVLIQGDGKWTALGEAKLDSRLEWGPPSGELLVYITSGTAILVDRVTGAEDMLPLKRVSRIVWGPAALPVALGVAMDADLYFLAADSSGVNQLWRLPRDGFPLTPITQSSVPVTDYTINPDTIRYVAGVALTVNLDGSPILPAIATEELRPRSTVTRRPPTTTPVTAEIRSLGWQPGPLAVQRVLKTGTVSPTYLLEGAILSPTGKFAVGYRGSPSKGQLVILDWTSGRMVTLQGVQSATALRWIP